ncbi:MAG: AMP-binding enzyme, partial [Acidimicrobiales bacterium]
GLVRPRAYVVVRAGADVSAESLIAHARSQLSPHKRPRDVVLVDALPRTANGKLGRQALLDLDRTGAP